MATILPRFARSPSSTSISGARGKASISGTRGKEEYSGCSKQSEHVESIESMDSMELVESINWKYLKDIFERLRMFYECFRNVLGMC